MRQEAGSDHVYVTVETAWEDAHPVVPMAISRAGLGRGTAEKPSSMLRVH